ncbi:hypothetical protein BDZ90DRAFT_127223 [Jaminaea rosea]|uniref:Uncharacterized protein n=1 Tax=Jaminaea rosea TaxID=1569628 RepID=A0A316UG84_9BASI|nr:hypothetical protein BDZ90DRAFT_127223 [Jaminaea rosea]PWN24337.1 hypothetical protein BDZ90DRAFT_127223 [Jaminaea rosea]
MSANDILHVALANQLGPRDQIKIIGPFALGVRKQRGDSEGEQGLHIDSLLVLVSTISKDVGAKAFLLPDTRQAGIFAALRLILHFFSSRATRSCRSAFLRARRASSGPLQTCCCWRSCRGCSMRGSRAGQVMSQGAERR